MTYYAIFNVATSVAAVGTVENGVFTTEAYYATLQEAVDAGEGKTVQILTNIDLAGQVEITKSLTLDLNEKTINHTGDDIWNTEEGNAWSLISVQGSGVEVTVTGAGTLQAKENDTYAMDVRDGAKLTLEGGRYIGNIHAVYVHTGELTVNGGYYEVQQTYSAAQPYDFTLNCWDANYTNGTAKITVNGGSFYKFDPQASNSEPGGVLNETGAGYVAIKDGDNYVVQEGATITFMNGETVMEEKRIAKDGEVAYSGEAPTKTADAAGVYSFIGWNTTATATEALASLPAAGTTDVTYYAIFNVATSVASVTHGTDVTYYPSLAAAFTAVADGDTITMLANSVEAPEPVLANGASVTLDLNGKTVTANDDIWVKTGSLTIVGTEGSAISSTGYALYVSTQGIANNEATLTINSSDMTINAGATGVVLMSGGIFNLEAGTITGSSFGIATNGTNNSTEKINIKGGAITGGTAGIYLPSGALTVTGGEISGETGIFVRGGTLNIPSDSTATISGTGEKALPAFAPSGDGASGTGEAVTIVESNYPNPITGTTIAGGTFTSVNADAVGSYAINDTLTAPSGFVSGGAFSSKVADEYAADGYWPEHEMVDGYYHVDTRRTVIFNANKGKFAEDKEELTVYVADGETVLLPDAPTKGIEAFDGWYEDKDGEFKFNITTTFTESNSPKTLFAKWTESVARINDIYYKTLQDAVNAAQAGDTITLLADIELPAKLTITDDKTITLNFNGHNIDTTATKYIENNGNLTLTDSSAGEDSGITASRYGIYNKGTLTIGAGAQINSGRYGVYQVGTDATTNLKAGTITGTQAAVYAVSGAVTARTGSTAELLGTVRDVYGANKSLSGGYYSKKVPENYIAEGYTCTTEPADNGLYQIVGAIGVTFKANLEGAEYTAQTGLTVDGTDTTKATMSGAEGETITLPTASRDNSVFLGWSYDNNVLAYGSSFELPATAVEMTGLWLTAVDNAYADATAAADNYVSTHYNKHSNGQNIDADDTFYVKVVDGPVGEVSSITLNGKTYNSSDTFNLSVGMNAVVTGNFFKTESNGLYVAFPVVLFDMNENSTIAFNGYTFTYAANDNTAATVTEVRGQKATDSAIEVEGTEGVYTVTHSGLKPATEWIEIEIEDLAANQVMITKKIITDANGNSGTSYGMTLPDTSASGGQVLAFYGFGYNASEAPTGKDGTSIGYQAYLVGVGKTAALTLDLVCRAPLTVTFDTQSDTVIEPQKVDYGKTATRPGDPTKTGYKDPVWQLNDTNYDFNNPVTEDITLTAAWTPITYTIKFDKNDNDATGTMADVTATYDVEPEITNAFTKDNYTLAGWAPKADETNTVLSSLKNLTTEDGATVELKAIWTQNEYVTVTYKANDNSATEDLMQTPVYVDVATALYNLGTEGIFTREGYTLTGWNTKASGKGIFYDLGESVELEKNLTLYAVWEINTITVTFNANEGTVDPTTMSGEYNTTITLPTPVREGYAFKGWKIGEAAETDWLQGGVTYTLPAADVTMEAQWAKLYTLTFVDGEETIATITGVEGAAITAPANPTKDGYTFTGWTSSSETVKNVPGTMPAEDVTFRAQWANNTWTATAATAGATVEGNTFKYSALELGYSPIETTIGRYWDAAWVGINVYAPETVTAENIESVKYDRAGNATIKGLYFGGTDARTGSSFANNKDGEDPYYIGVWVPLSAESVEAALNVGITTIYRSYSFYFENAPTDKQTFTVEIDISDLLLTKDGEVAIKTEDGEIVEQTVTFDADNGTEPTTETVRYGKPVAEPTTAPTKEGYKDPVWQLDGADYNFSTPVINDITLKAAWTAEKYTIKFVNEGYDPDKDQPLYSAEFEYGVTPTYGGQTPTKTFAGHTYTFAGWENIEDVEDKSIQPVTGEATYMATYTDELNVHTLKFYDDDGRMFDYVTAKFGTAITVPTPSKTGYELAGWLKGDATEVEETMPETMPDEDAVYTAKWTAKQYTVTFDLDGGEWTETAGEVWKKNENTGNYEAEFEYNAPVTAPKNPTRDGYTFAGWSRTIPSNMLAENVEIKALWTVNTYAVWFEDWDGRMLGYAEYEFEDNIAAEDIPTDPTRETDEEGSWEFKGWTEDPEADEPVTLTKDKLAGTTVTGYVTYVAYYEKTGDAVARIDDGTFYTSLSEAVAAAKDRQTIDLLKDTTDDFTVSDGKQIWIDLGGNTLTVDADEGIKATDDSELYLRNGVIESDKDDIISANGGVIRLEEDLAVNCTSSVIYAYNGGRVDIDGANVSSTSTKYAAAFATGAGSEINMYDGSLSKTGSNNVTLSVKNGASANLNGGTLTNDASSTIVATGEGTVITIDDNANVVNTVETPAYCVGYSVQGGRIVMHNGYVRSEYGSGLIATGNSFVEVNGGTIEAEKGNAVLAHEGNATATINGGTFIGNVGAGSSNNGGNNSLTINNGDITINGKVISVEDKGEVEARGGEETRYQAYVEEKDVEDGFLCTTEPGDDGYYHIVEARTVRFWVDGAEGTYAEVKVPHGEKVPADKMPEAPETENLVFRGWYEGEDEFNCNDYNIDRDFDLWARWTETDWDIDPWVLMNDQNGDKQREADDDDVATGASFRNMTLHADDNDLYSIKYRFYAPEAVRTAEDAQKAEYKVEGVGAVTNPNLKKDESGRYYFDAAMNLTQAAIESQVAQKKTFSMTYQLAWNGFGTEDNPGKVQTITVTFSPKNLTLNAGEYDDEGDPIGENDDPQLQVENWEIVDKNQNLTVEFYANEDDENAWRTETVRYNHEVEWFDAMPEKEGHSFNRWVYVNEDETDENVYEFSFSDRITEDKKVIAEWSVDPVYVHFMDEVYGDWDAAPEYNTTVEDPGERTTYGQVFLGWFEVENAEAEIAEDAEAFDFDTKITKETWIRAKWDAAVAQRGDKGYTSLSAAVAEGDGYTIELLTDTTDHFTTAGSMYINLNGHTLMVDEAKGIQSTGGELHISNGNIVSDMDDIISAKGGTIYLEDDLNVACGSSAIWAYNGGKVYINGANVNSTSTAYVAAFADGENAEIILNNGTLSSSGNNAATAQGGGIVTINGGSLEGTSEGGWPAAFSSNGGKIVVNEGNVYTANGWGLIAAGRGLIEVNGGTVNGGILAHEGNTNVDINGGTINGDVKAGAGNGGTNNVVTINNGDITINGSVESVEGKGTVTAISGGQTNYSVYVEPEDVEEGYLCTTQTDPNGYYHIVEKVTVTFKNGEETFAKQEIPSGEHAVEPTDIPTTTEAKAFGFWTEYGNTPFDFNTNIDTDTTLNAMWLDPVASVTSGENATYYLSLTDAVEAAVDGDTITMLADDALQSWVTVNCKVTLDLNGHTVETTSRYPLENNASLTIKDSGEDGAIVGVTYGIINNGDLIVESGEISATRYAIYQNGGDDPATIVTGGRIEAQYGVFAKVGMVTITGNETEGTEDDAIIIGSRNDVYKGTGVTVTISGGWFSKKVDENNCKPTGHKPTDAKDDAPDPAAPYTVEPIDYEAHISKGGEEKDYETFAGAAEAAEEGDVIILLKDVAEPYELENGTLQVKKDDNDLTVTAPAGKAIEEETDEQTGITTYRVVDAVASVTIGEETTYFASFEEAKEFADENGKATIDLLKDDSYTFKAGDEANVKAAEDVTFTYDVEGANCVIETPDGETTNYTVVPAVAAITTGEEPETVTTYYPTFEKAAEAAADEDVIELLDDVAEPYVMDGEVGDTLQVKKGENELTITAPEGKAIEEKTDPDTGITTYTVVNATYAITYELNGGTNSEANPATYSAGIAEPIQLLPATKEYYDFAGWFTDPNFDPATKLEKIAVGTTVDIKVYAKWEDAVTFLPTLNLADYTGIYVYIHIPDGENPDDYTVKVSAKKSIFPEAEKSEILSTLPTFTRDRGTEKVLCYRIEAIRSASPEMTDIATVKLFKGGQEVKTEEFSIRSIAEERLNSGTLPENQVAIHKALLQYGHYAQIQFLGGTSDMVVPEGAPAMAKIPDSFAPTADPSGLTGYITAFDARADLASAISMNVYLTPASGYTLNDFEISVTDKDGKAYTNYTAPTMNGNRIHIKIQGMLSPQIGRDFNITVKLKKDASKTATWTRSVMSCAYVIQQTNTNPATQNLVKALCAYYNAAAELWPSLM